LQELAELTVSQVFDNGVLKDDLVNSQKMVDALLSTMRQGSERSEARESKDKLIEVHDTVWERLVKVSLSLLNLWYLYISDSL
jgi:hypothetical protein